MQNSPFAGFGSSTFLVGVAAVKVGIGNSGQNLTSYRVLNLQGTLQRFTVGLTSAVTAGAAPAAGVETLNTVAMLANAEEIFTFPPNAWFIANVAGAFEITAGEGS